MKRFLLAFLVLLIPALALAQGSLRGVVTDTDGEPLIGASVQVAGTNQYALTDTDGTSSSTAAKRCRFTSAWRATMYWKSWLWWATAHRRG